ncbi:hypothetical protein [Fulvimonas yonginensis]|uniref:Uncharacterized protein n=1 Tax=Fulvimonas yonginensis TaxID=1495200 RepID=A0ABU8JD13_9GAMM
MSHADTATAAELMMQFAVRTGLVPGTVPVRYLWTDAFAACNFQTLAELGAGSPFETLAGRTVAQVHEVLGHFREDDRRRGWLRGAHGQADEQHPTRAGLRIGKPLPERRADEAFDDRLGWNRDGQYFHYLTRWMQALDTLACRRGVPHLHRWACELAETAHRAFTHAARGGDLRMYWQMSTDLSRPLVATMGQHDPLDGRVTALTLRATGQALGESFAAGLERAAKDYAAMLERCPLVTADPLGLGGLLMDAARLERLLPADEGTVRPLDRVLESAETSLAYGQVPLQASAETLLGFRELGLAIGLGAVQRLAQRGAAGPLADAPRTRQRVDRLRARAPLRSAIQAFWLKPANRAAATWTARRDISEVMLASSLLASP